MSATVTFPIPDLRARAVVAIPMAVAGVAGNLLLFASLVRPSSQLNQTRNLSLTILAFADLICCVSTLQEDIESVMPSQHWKSNRDCLVKKTYAIWAADLEYMMMWVIAVDRAMVIKWSVSYDISTRIAWVRRFLIGISFAYATAFTAYAWLHASDEMLVPLCHIVTAIQPVLTTLTPFRSVIKLMVISTHLIAYILSKKLTEDHSARRIQQSILLIGLVYIASSISMTVIYVVTHVVLDVSQKTSFLVLTWASLVARIHFISNCFILAIRSEDFRVEYGKTLKAIKEIVCGKKSNVVSVQPAGA